MATVSHHEKQAARKAFNLTEREPARPELKLAKSAKHSEVETYKKPNPESSYKNHLNEKFTNSK